MRRSQVLWVVIAVSFLSLSSVLAHASTLPPGDPGMQVDDPTCTPTSSTQNVTSGQIFTFQADSSGNGCFGFNVVGNLTFSTLDFQVGQGNAVPASSVTCSSNAFTCTNPPPSNLDDGTVTDVFFKANSFVGCEVDCGFPPGTFFTVLLQQWDPNSVFYGDSNLSAPADNPNLIQQFNAPEPSSVFLLSAGVGALALRRKIFKRRD